MKKIIWAIGIILFLTLSYVAAGPYLTISAIKTAVVEKDSEKLSENIEFPLLRQNLKDQFNARIAKNVNKKLKDNPFGLLALGIATTIINGMVDTYITPDGLAILMQGKNLSGINENDNNIKPLTKDDIFKNAHYTYDSINKFSIWMPNENGTETRFILERNGFSWRMINIILPIDNMQ